MTRRHARLVVVRRWTGAVLHAPAPFGPWLRFACNTAILLAFFGAMAVIDHLAHIP